MRAKQKPIVFTIKTTIDEEIDAAMYGDFHSFSRMSPSHPGERNAWAQIKAGDPWYPVNDWKTGRYVITADRLRAVARHFIEIGKHMSGLIDPAELREEIDRRMTENCELAEKVGEAFGHRAVEDDDILAIIDRLLEKE